ISRRAVSHLTRSVSILMGSESDREIAKKAETVLEKLSIPFETKVLSSHRNHKELDKYVEASKSDVFIAIAGLSAALPGFVASLTNKPVIGVPVSGKLNLDSILSIVQLPSGVPVGTVGLDNGTNAALSAAEILALSDTDLAKSLQQYRSGRAQIQEHLSEPENELSATPFKRGKVKDIYELDSEQLLFVFTDRVSAYDIV